MSTISHVDEQHYALLESDVNRFLDEYEASSSGMRYMISRPRRTAAAFADARRLPMLRMSPSRTTEGAAVRRELSRGSRMVRTPLHTVSGAISIPSDPAEYEAGAAKQTLRRKIRSSAKRGVTWEHVTDAGLRRELVALADDYERVNPRERYRATDPCNADLLDYELWLLARSAEGEPLVLAVTPVDDGVAALRYFRTLSADAAASDARYLMTHALVGELSRRGVRYLVDTTISMHLAHGLRHFQRMVGFRLLRIDFTDR